MEYEWTRWNTDLSFFKEKKWKKCLSRGPKCTFLKKRGIPKMPQKGQKTAIFYEIHRNSGQNGQKNTYWHVFRAFSGYTPSEKRPIFVQNGQKTTKKHVFFTFFPKSKSPVFEGITPISKISMHFWPHGSNLGGTQNSGVFGIFVWRQKVLFFWPQKKGLLCIFRCKTTKKGEKVNPEKDVYALVNVFFDHFSTFRKNTCFLRFTP